MGADSSVFRYTEELVTRLGITGASPLVEGWLGLLPTPLMCGTSLFIIFRLADLHTRAVHAVCSETPFAKRDSYTDVYFSFDDVLVVGTPLLCDCTYPPILAKVSMQASKQGNDPSEGTVLFYGPVLDLFASVLGEDYTYSSALNLRNFDRSKPDPALPARLQRTVDLSFPLLPEDGLNVFLALTNSTALQELLAEAVPQPVACNTSLTFALRGGAVAPALGGATLALACNESAIGEHVHRGGGGDMGSFPGKAGSPGQGGMRRGKSVGRTGPVQELFLYLVFAVQG